MGTPEATMAARLVTVEGLAAALRQKWPAGMKDLRWTPEGWAAAIFAALPIAAPERQALDVEGLVDRIAPFHKPRPSKTVNAFGIEVDGLTCRTCLNPWGKPAAWPCETMKAVDAVLPLSEWSDHYRVGCDHGMSAHGATGCRDCRCTTPGFSMPTRDARLAAAQEVEAK